VSDTLHLRGTNICPAQLNSLSTAALLGKGKLYVIKASAKHGQLSREVIVTSASTGSRQLYLRHFQCLMKATRYHQ